MPINNREPNAPANMVPYLRELEAELADIKKRLSAAESTIRGLR